MTPHPGDEPSFTPQQLAARWRVSVPFVTGLIHAGALRASRIGPRLIRITPEAVAEYEASRIVAEPKKPDAGLQAQKSRRESLSAAQVLWRAEKRAREAKRRAKAVRRRLPDASALPSFYMPQQLAERWGLSAEVVRFRIHRGELRGFRVGVRLLRVTAEAIAEYEASIAARRAADPHREAEKKAAEERARNMTMEEWARGLVPPISLAELDRQLAQEEWDRRRRHLPPEMRRTPAPT